MNTSILAALVAGMLLTGQEAAPTWQTNYGQALVEGTTQKKPLAVVFGSGPDGWKKVVRENPSAELSQLLKEQYVCVYVDTASAYGKNIAQSFGISSPVGLVISDRTGKLQAFSHQGDLANTAMVRYLTKYSAPSIMITTTETNPSSRTSFYPAEASGATDGVAAPFVPGSSYCPSCNNARGRR